MIVHMRADFVPSDKVDAYLEELRRDVLPLYSQAAGFMSVTILRRQLVAYGEVVTISCWNSEGEIREFLNQQWSLSPGTNFAVIQREAVTYEVIP
jgi:heme-degrading monooxygenase HmoA